MQRYRDQANTDLENTLLDLAETALRVKKERDDALALLRLVLERSSLGRDGPLKTQIRAFLAATNGGVE